MPGRSDAAQATLWKQLSPSVALPSPDTWEVSLSGGADKRETFERLLTEGRLGYLALLRNLRNMDQAGVDEVLVREAILARKGAHRVLPFRFVAAARAAPRFEPWLDEALMEAVLEGPVFSGRTHRAGRRVRVDGRALIGAIGPDADGRGGDARRLSSSGDLRVFTFSNAVVEVPARRGMAGVDAIVRSQPHGGTDLGKAVDHVNRLKHDRLIVVTDEQAAAPVPAPRAAKAYLVNVASAQQRRRLRGLDPHRRLLRSRPALHARS